MSCFDRFSCEKIDNAYFVGANTPGGFQGDFPLLFSEGEFKKVFIIKGGSGTGKSTVMRRAAKSCKAAGAEATYLLCSSDPDSLDGVLLEKNGVKIAIVDGTAPHTLDPVLAGACGEIFNSGDCWNTEYLEAHVGEIREIVENKKECYNAAYRFISGAAEVWEMIGTLARRVLNYDKMNACAARLASSVGACHSGGAVQRERRTYALSMKGAVRISSFDTAKTVVSVEDCAGVAPMFMKAVSNAFLHQGCDVTVSVSPFGDIWEVYVPACDTALVIRREGVEYSKNINLRRFVNKEEMQNTRQKRRFAYKCFDTLLDGALENLSDAWKLHSELEKIYVGAMDFASLDAMTEKLSQRLCRYFNV